MKKKEKEDVIRINYIYDRLAELSHIKGLCLCILRDLENKEILNEREEFWKDEISILLFT